MSEKDPDHIHRKERPSERMFRRSRRAEMRRRQAAREDANFFRAVFSLAGVATAFVFVIIYMASANGGSGMVALAPLSEPWIGPFSRLEIFGVGLIIVLGAVFWFRIKKRP